VQASCALIDPLASNGGRVVREDSFPRIIALPEADAASVEQVDGRVNQHGANRGEWCRVIVAEACPGRKTLVESYVKRETQLFPIRAVNKASSANHSRTFVHG
jgi:hypothetical protein